MLYFSKINKDENFVGLRTENHEPIFCLPKGFENFDESDFQEVKKVFFLFYKLFKKYSQHRKKGHTSENKTFFESSENEQIQIFDNFDSLDCILEAYDEPLISALYKKEYKSKELDFNKFHLYLHKAVYVQDVIFLEDMYAQRQTVVKESPPLTALFCYIFSEIKNELGQKEELSFQILELAEKFKEKYLAFNVLFSENFEQNIEQLKVIFEEIHAQSHYKDADYWHFFDAIENFLYPKNPKNGEIWGISKFYPIWEELCLAYTETFEGKILADKGGKLHFYGENYEYPFRISLRNHRKELRPDFIYKTETKISSKEDIYIRIIKSVEPILYYKHINKRISFYEDVITRHERLDNIYRMYYKDKYRGIWGADFEEFENEIFDYAKENVKSENYFLVDFKYHSEKDFEADSEKISRDIRKQLFYEWTIQENIKADVTKSYFYIPSYSLNDNIELESFEKNNITVQKINLLELINKYLK